MLLRLPELADVLERSKSGLHLAVWSEAYSRPRNNPLQNFPRRKAPCCDRRSEGRLLSSQGFLRLQDIAGVRIICYFVDDIYNLAKSLKRQADLIVIREQDYIKAPKPNGYRSYHLIVGVPVYCMDGMEYFPVEVQLRTLSMDFWASMEHRISYKKERAAG